MVILYWDLMSFLSLFFFMVEPLNLRFSLRFSFFNPMTPCCRSQQRTPLLRVPARAWRAMRFFRLGGAEAQDGPPQVMGSGGGSPGWLMLSLFFLAKRWLWLKHVKSVDLQFWHQNWNLMIIDLTWRNHSLIVLHSVYSFVTFCLGTRHQMQNVFRVRSRSDSRSVTTKHVQSGNIYPLVI